MSNLENEEAVEPPGSSSNVEAPGSGSVERVESVKAYSYTAPEGPL